MNKKIPTKRTLVSLLLVLLLVTCSIAQADGANKNSEDLNATGHNYVMHVVRVATIDEDGENQYVCQNCGDSYSVHTGCYDE